VDGAVFVAHPAASALARAATWAGCSRARSSQDDSFRRGHGPVGLAARIDVLTRRRHKLPSPSSSLLGRLMS